MFLTSYYIMVLVQQALDDMLCRNGGGVLASQPVGPSVLGSAVGALLAEEGAGWASAGSSP